MANASAPVGDPRPLLAFPAQTTGRIPPPDGPSSFPPRPRAPSPGQQGARLTPQFGALRDALESERAQLAEATAASDPELVAVFDLAGSVDDFVRAAARIEGLEFLADLEEDPVEPDDDFYFEKNGEITNAAVSESLYMVMTNAQAVTELVRLFELWQADQSITFARGLNPLKQVFGLLRAIRRWGPEDRVRETGLLEQWVEDIAVMGTQGTTRVEIELWYRSDGEARSRAEADVSGIIEAARGAVVATSDRSEIAYHGLLADIPTDQVERVLAEGVDSIELLTTDAIMMVSPSRPMSVVTPEPAEVVPSELGGPRPTG